MTVVEDVLVGGVEAGFDAVLHHLTGSGRRLKLLDLNTTLKRASELGSGGCTAKKKKTKKLTDKNQRRDGTFILKKVILVRRSTVDLRSCSRSGLLAGKLFCSQTKKKKKHARDSPSILVHRAPVGWEEGLTRYMDRSILSEL